MLSMFCLEPVDNWMWYGSLRLYSVLLAKELARNIEASSSTSSVLSLACHPGFFTNYGMNNWEKMNAGNEQSAADGSLLLICWLSQLI